MNCRPLFCTTKTAVSHRLRQLQVLKRRRSELQFYFCIFKVSGDCVVDSACRAFHYRFFKHFTGASLSATFHRCIDVLVFLYANFITIDLFCYDPRVSFVFLTPHVKRARWENIRPPAPVCVTEPVYV